MSTPIDFPDWTRGVNNILTSNVLYQLTLGRACPIYTDQVVTDQYQSVAVQYTISPGSGPDTVSFIALWWAGGTIVATDDWTEDPRVLAAGGPYSASALLPCRGDMLQVVAQCPTSVQTMQVMIIGQQRVVSKPTFMGAVDSAQRQLVDKTFVSIPAAGSVESWIPPTTDGWHLGMWAVPQKCTVSISTPAEYPSIADDITIIRPQIAALSTFDVIVPVPGLVATLNVVNNGSASGLFTYGAHRL